MLPAGVGPKGEYRATKTSLIMPVHGPAEKTDGGHTSPNHTCCPTKQSEFVPVFIDHFVLSSEIPSKSKEWDEGADDGKDGRHHPY